MNEITFYGKNKNILRKNSKKDIVLKEGEPVIMVFKNDNWYKPFWYNLWLQIKRLIGSS